MAFTAKIADLIAQDATGLLTKHESWERIPLSEVASILNGAPFDSSRFSTTTGIPLARIRDVIAGETSTYYTGEYDDAYLLQQGDLLIGMDGDFNTGYWGARLALLNQRVCRVTPNSEFYDKKLLGYVLPGYLAAINANTPSITVKHLSSKTVGEIELPLPPRAEQARIVEKLEELLSDLDAGIAELKAAQRKLAQYRQSLLKAAVEGALTADWRATKSTSSRRKPDSSRSSDDQPQKRDPGLRRDDERKETGAELLQRLLSERRTRWEQKQLAKFAEQGKTPPKGWQTQYPEPASPDHSDLPSLPAGWAWATAEQICVFVTKGTTPSKSLSDDGEKSVPFLRVTNLTSTGALNFTDTVFVSRSIHEGFLARSVVYPNDVLMNIVGPPLGQVSIVPSDFSEWNVNQAIAIFRAVHGVLPAFLAAYLLSTNAQRWLKKRAKTTAGQTNLTLEVCRELPIPLPSMHEQQAIVQQFDVQMTSLSDQLGAVDLALRQAAAQRKNILKAAFSGQLVPQDPNDEPASALLARIRVQREASAGTPARKRGRKARGAA